MYLRSVMYLLWVMCPIAGPGAKTALFRHWYSQYILSSTRIRNGTFVGGTADAGYPRAHDVYTTSAQRRCNVMTLHRC